MVSSRTTLAIMAVIAACFFATQAMSSDKCKFKPEKLSDADKKSIAECYSEATGKPFDPANCDIDSQEQSVKDKMCMCFSIKSGIVDGDGHFHGEKVKELLGKMEMEDHIRNAVNEGIDACIAAGGDTKEVSKCSKAVMKKECDI